eukprot:scaffold90109_cov39-Phaeocystis_antarctica.AAC.1
MLGLGSGLDVEEGDRRAGLVRLEAAAAAAGGGGGIEARAAAQVHLGGEVWRVGGVESGWGDNW